MAQQQQDIEQRAAQWLKGVLDLCVLGLLRNREAYGYELARRLEEAGMGVIKGGTLYPILNRLETDGYLSVAWRSSDQGPNRKYYRLTADGKALLDHAGKEWTSFAETTAQLIAVEEVDDR
ncbi:MAG: PadR family transcriptional regulator [Acidimicrobiia bacterium]|nr:PadR family transcriptional regulator [Acidimicrobiia bacterium]